MKKPAALTPPAKTALESPRCNLCGRRRFSVFLSAVTSWEHPGVFRLVQCQACELIYLHPRPTLDQIGQYYPKSSYWGQDLIHTQADRSWKVKRDHDYALLYQLIFKHAQLGPVLDVGAGTGVFLSRFAELHWPVLGTEFSADAVKFGKKAYGVNMRAGDLLTIKLPANHYQVVTLNNALEHLYQPLETLQYAHRLMKEDGLLVITVPNIQSLGARIFGRKWFALQPPRHLYHFSKQTLSEMVRQAGFEPIGVSHWYTVHNYACLFESIRQTYAPKFQQQAGGGLAAPELFSQPPAASPSLVKELVKLAVKLLARGLAWFGSVTGQSEVITLYAVKKSA